jgi:diguanylate cyclase (GGDEF)-like protein
MEALMPGVTEVDTQPVLCAEPEPARAVAARPAMPRDRFDELVDALKDHQDRLLSHGRHLETILAEWTVELAREKTSLESSVAERVARLNGANDALRKQAALLMLRNQEVLLTGRMNDFLQSCTTEAEAYAVISGIVTQLFPGHSGAVFVLNASRDLLEATATWGPLPPAKRVFPPEECWANRRGQVHLAAGREQRCIHVAGDERVSTCLPLLAQGETLGILHLLDDAPAASNADDLRTAQSGTLAKILADSIGLGIANLKLRESMRNLSIRDPLTGLFNRRYMEEGLALELHRSRRNAAQLAVIMVDIDHFKRFNDSFGHDGGDAVLRALGKFLRKHVRGSDIACRYGGEEFALILSPSTAAGALARAEKIRANAARLDVRHAGQDLGAITLSLGVAMFPDHATEAMALVKAADVALYQAKSGGRNRVVMQGPPRPDQVLSAA